MEVTPEVKSGRKLPNKLTMPVCFRTPVLILDLYAFILLTGDVDLCDDTFHVWFAKTRTNIY